MSRYTELTEAEREYIRARVACAPSLNESQKSIIRASFAGVLGGEHRAAG
jgi:hypothetical protein